jgi:thiosulfate dehydrogenase [quinone] large subunit
MLIGWHFLYEGLIKILNPNWTAAEYLAESKGPLAGFFTWFVAAPARLAVVDFLNQWGLLLIGLGLIAGFLTRYASFSGLVLLILYYLCNPPFPAYTYTMPAEGSYLVVNKVLVEAAALWVLFQFPTGKVIGLDRLLGVGHE